MAFVNDAIYDGWSFKDNGLVLVEVGHLVIAPRNNQIENRANRSGGVLVQSQNGIKNIPLSGYYIGTSSDDAQNMYDTIAQAMNRQQRVLQIPHAGGVRRYTATPSMISIQEPDGLNRLTFSIEFAVPDGYAISDVATVLVGTTITTASASIPISINGSEKARPYYTMTLSSLTGASPGSISFRNGRDLVGLTITRNFANSDIITIDSENFQIFINGVLTAPVGRMPTWDPGSGSIYYSDTFTTRSVRLDGTYKQKNL